MIGAQAGEGFEVVGAGGVGDLRFAVGGFERCAEDELAEGFARRSRRLRWREGAP